jgi:crossover junction endodeoxyribonuclease RuvC
MKIISIDPGYERLGIAIIEKPAFSPKQNGSNKTYKAQAPTEILLFSECFKTSAKLPHHERLALIGNRIREIIQKYRPEAMATEKLFFSSNQKTAMLVAEARGTILYSCSSSNLDIFEYTPNEIKIAITGYGRSEKKQIIDMVKKLIVVNSNTNSDDEFDAIAIGLTHFAIHR